MDFVNKAMGGGGSGGENKDQQQGENKQEGGGGGFLGGIGNKLNSAAGGGKESEKNEDYLDKGSYSSIYTHVVHSLNPLKGVDYVQEHVLGQGDQSNESAVEQAKDEKISDFIRDKYKSSTGKDVPIEDKPTKFS